MNYVDHLHIVSGIHSTIYCITGEINILKLSCLGFSWKSFAVDDCQKPVTCRYHSFCIWCSVSLKWSQGFSTSLFFGGLYTLSIVFYAFHISKDRFSWQLSHRRLTHQRAGFGVKNSFAFFHIFLNLSLWFMPFIFLCPKDTNLIFFLYILYVAPAAEKGHKYCKRLKQ